MPFRVAKTNFSRCQSVFRLSYLPPDGRLAFQPMPPIIRRISSSQPSFLPPTRQPIMLFRVSRVSQLIDIACLYSIQIVLWWITCVCVCHLRHFSFQSAINYPRTHLSISPSTWLLCDRIWIMHKNVTFLATDVEENMLLRGGPCFPCLRPSLAPRCVRRSGQMILSDQTRESTHGCYSHPRLQWQWRDHGKVSL